MSSSTSTFTTSPTPESGTLSSVVLDQVLDILGNSLVADIFDFVCGIARVNTIGWTEDVRCLLGKPG